MGRPCGSGRRGRPRVQLRRFQDGDRWSSTFAKLSARLFRKASELSALTGAQVALVAFAKPDLVYAYGNPSVDATVQRFEAGGGAPVPGVQENHEEAREQPPPAEEDDEAPAIRIRRATEETREQAAAEKARLDAVGERMLQAMAGKRYWWEADVEALGEEDLPEFVRALEHLRDNVRRRVDALLSGTASPRRQGP